MISLQDRHSFAIDVDASHLIELTSLEQLPLIDWTPSTYLLGEGTNSIFTTDFHGQLLQNRLRYQAIEETDDAYMVSLGAGENWHQWVVQLIEKGIAGFENLALIPGSVGAAPVQNIGAYGVEVSQFIESVDIYDFVQRQMRRLTHAECRFAYRDSVFKQPGARSWCITQVNFCLPKAWQPCLDYPDLQSLEPTATATEIMQHVISVRERKLPNPAVIANAGSFFKNPVVPRSLLRQLQSRYARVPSYAIDHAHVKLAAGWLIDQAGLKSMRVGGAGVHQRQALVLVNSNNATGEDVLTLARQVQKQVQQRFSVELEPEVRLYGQNGLLMLNQTATVADKVNLN